MNKEKFFRYVLSTMQIVLVLSLLLAGNCTPPAGASNRGTENLDFEKLWKEVNQFYNKGLPKSALKSVTAIYNKAKKANHPAQLIKAMLHRMRFFQDVEENTFVKIQAQLTRELKNSRFPVTPLLHSLLAEQYWIFYQNNRYRILRRSTTSPDFKQDDIRTWDARKIVETIVSHYKKSMQQADKSRKTKIDIYDEILYNGTNSRKFRPTLYDFLAHRAIDFYKDTEAGLTKPRYQFTLHDDRYFSDTTAFAKLKLSSRDPLSFDFFAIGFLQKLVKFHLDDDDPSALVDVELKRLNYLYRKAVISNKDKLFEEMLTRLKERYADHPVCAEVWYQLARYYNIRGEKYKPGVSDDFKWDKKKARQLCTEAIKKYPGSIGARNCQSLIHQIEGKKLQLTLSNAEAVNTPSRALVKYKNLNTVYLKLVKTNLAEFREQQKQNQKNMVSFYLRKDPLKSWKSSLPDDGDYQGHSTEIKLDPQTGAGMYLLLAGTSSKFDYRTNGVAYGFFHITDIAFTQRQNQDRDLELYLLHRQTGHPLAHAKIQVWYSKYSRSQRRQVQKRGESLTADKNGYFLLKRNTLKRNYFHLEFIHNGQHLYVNRNFNLYKSGYRKDGRVRTIFFTDRAIYRPGQTVYFKGIKLAVYSRDSKRNKILPNEPATVILYDVNRQKIASLDLVSNEYGTFSGTFQLPLGRLNGNWSITDNKGNARFSVEEYKRPKFNVGFKPQKKSFRLNQAVTVTGEAKAYAGYNIDGAEVKYRVVRTVFYPYPWYCSFWYRGYYPRSSPMEIANGFTKTKADGSFEISFDAQPDRSISKKIKPAFTFTVYADVTDINGETRSNRKRINIGYEALKLAVTLPGQIDKQQKQMELSINSTTLDGDFIPSTGKLAIFKLKEPNRPFRTRPWPRPDKFIMDKKTFYKLFPLDEYNDENNLYKWQKGKTVWSAKFDTAKSKALLIKEIISWNSGKYMLEMTSKDRFGSDVKQVKYLTLYDSRGKTPPFKTYDWFTVVKGEGEPGQEAVILMGSDAKNVWVLYEIEHRRKIVQKKFLKLSKQQTRLNIPILEKHRGNLGVHLTFIKGNRLYNHSSTIQVPWSDKKLELSFATFRNKLLPGQKEEWRIKIKGPKGDQLAAEMVASLYDASLDAFRANNWNFNIFSSYYNQRSWMSNSYFNTVGSRFLGKLHKPYSYSVKYYDRINWFGFNWRSRYQQLGRRFKTHSGRDRALPQAAMPMKKKNGGRKAQDELMSVGKAEAPGEMNRVSQVQESITVAMGKDADGEPESSAAKDEEKQEPLKIRTNFNETAFFYPHLKTNAQGEVIVSFTVPEALTKWKMMGFAHTKKLQHGFLYNELVTQKELMVVPNAPRFFREGDDLVFTSKVTNLSDNPLTGTAHLTLLDAVTMKPVSLLFNLKEGGKPIKVKKGGSTLVKWRLHVPDNLDAVTYRLTARAGKFSDGEEKAIPVLTNRMLVTESMPLPVRSMQTKKFAFKKLINSSSSKTLKHHKVTLEFTSNPVWYAVQALPYLMEYPHECMEQTFSRFYANSLASYIVHADPRIKRVFDLWQKAVHQKESANGNALLSNLQKNQELKSVLLEETPWVLNGQNESQRKRRIAMLFDLNSLAAQLDRALTKLKEGQLPSGTWPWFKGMRPNRYITQHIVCGMAHLGVLKAVDIHNHKVIWKMMKEAVPYLDREITKDYKRLLQRDADLSKNHLGHTQVHYLYARSYFQDIPIHAGDEKAFNYYKKQVKTYWTDFHRNKYMQGMMALIMKRYGDESTALAIGKSIKEHALYSEEMGMYWKTSYGYYWYQMPIETHALLIEVFDEVMKDAKSVADLKTWLLKQKQTQDWRTTKATAEAVYALLLKGDQWIKESRAPELILGKKNPITINPGEKGPEGKSVAAEAGTGYFKTSWNSSEIKPDMGYVTVKNNNKIVAWGSLYWQYFQQLDKITPAKTPLHLKKKLFVEKPSDTGPVLHPITDGTILKVGDRIKVRIELRVDRNMEYVHMKDMRASTMEPEQVISGYRWQDGLGYYQSTKDASTNFFFDYLSKGTYVFEYPLRVTHEGDFSNGITTIQCMYAPEFTSHSEGVRVKIASGGKLL